MVPGDGIDPGFKIFDPVFGQFGDDLYKYLLDAIPGFFFVPEIFHADPEQEKGVSLKQ
jgi:hypothetical protein